MRTVILPYLCLIAFLLGTADAKQALYHVSAAGDDMNPGTEVDPFVTIQKAVDVAQLGDLHPQNLWRRQGRQRSGSHRDRGRRSYLARHEADRPSAGPGHHGHLRE